MEVELPRELPNNVFPLVVITFKLPSTTTELPQCSYDLHSAVPWF